MTNDKTTPKLKYSLAFANNAPNYYAVTTGKWGEKSFANCDTEENAELIVRAVNNFDSLLEACRSAKLAMETSGFASGYGKKVYERVCEAIAKATEGR